MFKSWLSATFQSPRDRPKRRSSRHATSGRLTTPLLFEQLERRTLLTVAPPADLVNWYRAEQSTLDFAGGNNAVQQNGTNFAGGMVGQAFQFDGVDDALVVPH